MRVMLLVESLTIGGLPNYVLDLGRALIECGENVIVAHANESVPVHLDTSSLPLLSISAADKEECFRLLSHWRPDVVHVHLCSDQAILHALQRLNVPLVRSFHDYTSMCLRRGRRRFPGDRCQRALGRACLLFGCALVPPAAGGLLPRLASVGEKLAERAIFQQFAVSVVGSYHMQRVLETNGFPRERIYRVPYFSRFDAQARGLVALMPKPAGVAGEDRPFRLLFAGQAVAGKGLHILVQALSRVVGRWQLKVVAAGPDLAACRTLAEHLGLRSSIEFLDWVPASGLEQLYREADIFVLPSIWDDPGPLVGIEAMSMGTPVVGFAVGGIPDYVKDGVTGFLVESVTPKGLADVLNRVLADGRDLKELGEHGQKLVASVHSRQQHVGAIQAVYRRALDSGNAHLCSSGEP